MHFYSQYGEDRWITEHVELPAHGVFVDVGALDGVTLSNTLHFEQQGWHGIVIEPDPRQAQEIRRHRGCIIETCAIDTEAGMRPFTLDAEPSWSGFLRTGDLTVRVACRTLATVLATYGLGHVDLLSIDTEGTELAVWASRPAGWNPTVVIIEHETAGLPDISTMIRGRFARDGYALAHTTQGNYIYIRTPAAP